MSDIFISYNRHDRHVARWFADAFHANGQDVWWDSEIASGEDFDGVIEQALKNAKVVIVLWVEDLCALEMGAFGGDAGG